MEFIVASAIITGVLGQIPSAYYGSFYPPNINSTEWITNSSIGLYNGVYSAGTYGPTYPPTYGAYDYCFMPHPRTSNYQKPGPVANGSVGADLVFLHYLQRHQRRTAYNILPSGENQEYNCDNIEPFLYGAPGTGGNAQEPMRVYAQSYTSRTNPLVDGIPYVKGSCQYPQLTIGGLEDGYQHGKDLWGVYGATLGLIPSTPDDSVWFRSSESALTQQSASGVLRGIWPEYKGALPLHQQATAVDTVNEGFSCDYRNTLLSKLEETDAWKAHIAATKPLQDSLLWATLNQSAWTETFDHLSDNFQSRTCNGYKLPCNVNNLTQCVTEEQAAEVFRAADWEWNYYWRTNPYVLPYIQTQEGLFIGELLDRWAMVENGTNTLKYVHEFIHDGDIGPITGALGITALRWPAMASNLAFEFW